ncbi:hypothetical protein EAb13_CDS0120 [Acinetobacter phage EAb13]|nr:hypothetical protein EAb13_CDS0002 [Acinetobacter phage EAb13]WGH24538.1 hypothetical protein EAb13_CDS0120 [Acinetobacter phage EAb13]
MLVVAVSVALSDNVLMSQTLPRPRPLLSVECLA